MPNETARSGAYELLLNRLLAGDFEEDGKSQVRFLHPNHETEWISRRRMIDLEKEKAVSLPDAMDTSPEDVIAQYLAHCWIPRRMFHRWLTKHGLPMPARFGLEQKPAAALNVGTRRQSLAEILPANTRRRGRRPVKIEQTKEAMRKDIHEGRLTTDQLSAMREKELPEKYGVSRTTARDARKVVLSEFVGNSISTNDI